MVVAFLVAALALAAPLHGQSAPGSQRGTDSLSARGSQATGSPPEGVYRVYVGAESADLLHRVRFGPEGGSLEASIPVQALSQQSRESHLLSDHEAPHGVAIHPERGVVFMTTGHGVPDGKLWKLEAGSGRLLAGPLDLGRFPASLDVSPDGLWVAVANFNLHGEMAPSSISVVFAGDDERLMEVAQVETCTMPHGSRFHPQGRQHYSVCMMDDQLVELDLGSMAVSRRLWVARGQEGPLPRDHRGFHDPETQAQHHGAPGQDVSGHRAHGDGTSDPPPDAHYTPSCSPTWVQPSTDGRHLYLACNASDEILEIHRDRWEVTRRFSTGRGPYNLDITPDDGLLVVTLKQGKGVEFIDLERGESVARVETSIRVVHGVAIAPDGRFAFVSVEGVGSEPGVVEIYDLSTFERVDRVEVGQQASGIAFWNLTPPPTEGG